MADKWTDSPDSKTLKGRLKSTFREPTENDSSGRAFAIGMAKGAAVTKGSATSVGGLAFLGATAICGTLIGTGLMNSEIVETETHYRPAPIDQSLSADIRTGVGHVGVAVDLGGGRGEYLLTKDENGYNLYYVGHGMWRSDPYLDLYESIEDAAFKAHQIARVLNDHARNLNDLGATLSTQSRPRMFTVEGLSILHDTDPSPSDVVPIRRIERIGDSPIRAGQDLSDQFVALAAIWEDAAVSFESGQISTPSENVPERTPYVVETITHDYTLYENALTAYVAYLGAHAFLALAGGFVGASTHSSRRQRRESSPEATATPAPKPTTGAGPKPS